MIEVVDKVIAEFRGGKSSPEDAGYEFHINHESSKSSNPSKHGNHSRTDSQSCLLYWISYLRLSDLGFSCSSVRSEWSSIMKSPKRRSSRR
jgi:hypothetical protein